MFLKFINHFCVNLDYIVFGLIILKFTAIVFSHVL